MARTRALPWRRMRSARLQLADQVMNSHHACALGIGGLGLSQNGSVMRATSPPTGFFKHL